MASNRAGAAAVVRNISGAVGRQPKPPANLVLSTDSKGHIRRVTVTGTDGRTVQLKLHRYAAVGKGDQLLIDPTHPHRMAVASCENGEDAIRLTPHFSATYELKLGAAVYPTKISEITTDQDLRDYGFLEQFHYKTSVLLENNAERGEEEAARPAADTGGRKAVLLCHVKSGTRWEPVGYIELQMPLLMVKPRHLLFERPFQHPERPVAWDSWDQHALTKYVNVVVRIARVVTSPEFRGLGIAKTLLDAALTFSRERWHIRGRRPLFVEISAEMLRYFDFVSSAGLSYVGATEGNIERVAKDLASMRKNPKITSGILSLQKKYLTNFKKAVDAAELDFDATLARLQQVCNVPESVHSVSPEEWYLFRTVIRLPIPYYIIGLDQYSNDYVEAYVRERQPKRPNDISFASTPISVSMRGLRATAHLTVADNSVVRKMMDCFGLKGERMSNAIFGPLDVHAGSGNIVFITGASGTGKSVLLHALDPEFSTPHIRTDLKQSRSTPYRAGWIREIPSQEAIIQYFSSQYGTERALAALNQAGLSEAFVYLKPYELLSRGQRYRAKLADLALRQDQVWLIDEFCADLDPLSARIVARNLRRHVIKHRRIAFVAAANYSHFLDALAPTRVLLLRYGGKSELFTYREFMSEFPDTAR